MKKMLLALALSVVSLTPVTAQEKAHTGSLDISSWGSVDNSGKNVAICPWIVIRRDANFINIRHSFDAPNVLSLYYGHELVKEWKSGAKLSFTPAIGGGMSTDNSGFSAVGITSHTYLEYKKFKIYTINQYLFGASPSTQNSGYNWTDIAFSPTKWLNIGAGDQIFYQPSLSDVNARIATDFGPSLGFVLGDFYIKAYAWDVWSETDRYYGVWAGIYLPK